MFKLHMPKNLSIESEEMSPNINTKMVMARSGVPWKPTSENLFAPALLDIDWLISQPGLPFLAHVAPAHTLYRSIMAHGFEDSLEVVEWVRGEQLQKILDFDIWEKSQELETWDISTSKIMSWIRMWMEISPEFAAQRIIELEEETIVLIFSKLFEIIPEGLYHINEDIKENWWKTADNKFYLKICHDDPEYFEILKPFIDSLYTLNARIAASILAHSTMLVRQESLEFGLRWKNSRLADQGFVSKEDALKALIPKELNYLKKLIQQEKEQEAKKTETIKKINSKINYNLLNADESVNSEIQDQIVQFLSKLDPEEGTRYLQQTLGEGTLKTIIGSETAKPEYFYEDDDFIVECAEKIITHCNMLLFRSESVYIKQLAAPQLLIEKVFIELSNKNLEESIYLKKRIANLSNILVSGAMNALNNEELARSLLIVRGALNIGLEYCLLNANEFQLNFNRTETDLEQGTTCLQLLGPEYVFQVGWSILTGLQKDLGLKIVYLDTNLYNGKLKSLRTITMSDSSNLEIPLNKLVENQRHPDINKWLDDIEIHISQELFLVFESLFGKVPMFSELLAAEKLVSTIKVQNNFKPFETLNEIESARVFINNIHHNLLMEA
jgi:hypothetical protein